MLKLIPHRRSREVEAWLKREIAEQKRRYRRIVAQQEALTPQRDRWIADFLQRIQTRGFHVHSNQLRKIRPEEIPVKPRRKFKVVF
ncbi:MAG: hypothetical protein NZM12_12420 [Steroidobacteraceae bacterium]|nr:hypothetical protein [Steroidobacteraceae bacterium]MDW8258205.1 hypothetical protein [Gammaproteobacteria bacterium]